MKDLERIVAENAAIPCTESPPALNDVLLRALKTAKNAMQDISRHGYGRMQRQNYAGDMGIVLAAIARLEKEMNL